jgi:uncharacterized protein involved in exopolysaccharide biosynthesis
MLANLTASLIAFILPKTYASSARLLLKPDDQMLTTETSRAAALATQIELMKSDLVLGSVVSQLGLADASGSNRHDEERARSSDPVKSLREQLEIRPIPNTTMIEIRAFSESPHEVVRIADLVASAYVSAFPNAGAQVVEKATLGRKPVRPNKPLIIGLGALGGFLLGGFVAAGVILLGLAKRQ